MRNKSHSKLYVTKNYVIYNTHPTKQNSYKHKILFHTACHKIYYLNDNAIHHVMHNTSNFTKYVITYTIHCAIGYLKILA